MRAHEAGALHAEGYGGPAWLALPRDVNALIPSAVGASVGRGTRWRADRRWRVDVHDLAREFGTPAYILDEDDFRSRARDFRDGFAEVFDDLGGGADVYYAGKAFLCTDVARWIPRRACTSTSAPAASSPSRMRAGFPGRADRLARQQQDDRRDRRGAAATAWAASSSTPSTRSTGSPPSPAELGVVAPVMVRVTVGVEAHTHEFIATGPRGPEVRLLPRRRPGGRGGPPHPRRGPTHLDLLGLHSHIGSQIFDTGGFEVAARRVLGLHARVADEHGRRAARDRPRRWLRHRLHHRARPAAAASTSRPAMAEIVDRECRRPTAIAGAPDLGRARSRDRRAEHLHPLRGRHRQGRSSSTAAPRAPTSPSTAG